MAKFKPVSWIYEKIDSKMEELLKEIKKLNSFLENFKKVEVTFHNETITEAKDWQKATAFTDISEVTFINNGTQIAFVNSIQLLPGGSVVFQTNWNEKLTGDFIVRFSSVIVGGTQNVIVSYKRTKLPDTK